MISQLKKPSVWEIMSLYNAEGKQVNRANSTKEKGGKG